MKEKLNESGMRIEEKKENITNEWLTVKIREEKWMKKERREKKTIWIFKKMKKELKIN